MNIQNQKFDVMVVLNTSYPFDHADPFLDNELPYMKKYAKKIIFLPLGAKDCRSIRVDLGNGNIAVHNLRESFWTRGFTDLAALTHKSFWREYRKYRKESNDLFSIVKILDHDAQFYRLKKIIRRILSAHIKDVNAKLLFYSYWLDFCAHLAGDLKEDYCNSIAISRAHGGDIYGEEQGEPYVPYRWECIQNLDAIYPVSDMGARYLAHRFPTMEEHVHCCRLGTQDQGINHLKLTAPFTIVSCSSLISLKRVHLIIEALALCNQQIRWVHFGDGELRATLEQQAKRLPKFVQWEFRGQISNEALMKIYRELSINMFINVSSSEGIPVSIMEALSFGIPVMATDVGGTKEAVIDGYNGKLLPANITPAELAQAIMNFRKELELSGDRYRNNARESWEKNYSAERNYTDFYEKVCALYEEICGKRNRGS